MEGVCNNLHRDSKLESTSSLRSFAEKSLTELQGKVSTNEDKTDKRETEIETNLSDLKNFSGKLRQEYDKWYKNSHYPDQNEMKMVEFYRQYIAKDTDEDEEDSENESKE